MTNLTGEYPEVIALLVLALALALAPEEGVRHAFQLISHR